MNLNRASILLLLILSNLSISAEAADMENLINKYSDACYERSYTPDHMKKHPEQTVTFIRFAHLPSLLKPEIRNSIQDSANIFQPIADIEVRFKGDSKLYGNSLICYMDNGKPLCGVECDGGSFYFRFKTNNDMLIDFRDTGEMVLESSCGEGSETNPRQLADKKDDRVFRLSPVDPAQCISTIKARHDAWASQQN